MDNTGGCQNDRTYTHRFGWCNDGFNIFLLDLFDKIEETSKLYLGMNILGGLFLCYYAYIGNVLPFFILNGVWTIASVIKLVRGSKRLKIHKS